MICSDVTCTPRKSWPSPLPCCWWGVGCNWYCWCVTSLPEHSEHFTQLASFTLSHLFIKARFLCSSALHLTFTHVHATVDALECHLWISGMQTGYLKWSCRLKSTVSSLVFQHSAVIYAPVQLVHLVSLGPLTVVLAHDCCVKIMISSRLGTADMGL